MDDGEFESHVAALVKALDTDLARVQSHTGCWHVPRNGNEREGTKVSFSVERTCATPNCGLRKAEAVIPSLLGYIPNTSTISRQGATRLQRIIIGAITVAFIIAAGLTVYAFMVQRLKEDALARSLSRKSATMLSKEGDTALAGLLALESVKHSSTDEGAQALRNALVYLRKTHTFFGGGTAVSDIAFSSDSNRLVTVGNENDPIARVYDVDSGKELLRLRHDGQVMESAFSPDAKVLLTGSKNDTACVWDAASGRELNRFQCGSEVTAVAISKQGMAGNGQPDRSPGLGLGDRPRVGSIGHLHGVRTVAFSPGGRWFASGGRDGSF